MVKDVNAFLVQSQQQETNPDLIQIWTKLEECYNKKLWHQLTLLLQDFVKNEKFQHESLLPLYENFIQDFENKINPLAFVEIAADIVTHIKDGDQAVEFLQKTQEKVKASTEAVILCKTLIGRIKLHDQKLDEAKKTIEEAQELLDTLDNVTSIHGRFYKLSSSYYRLVGKHAEYYKDALRYLGCTEISDIPKAEQAERAFYLGLAALLGDGVYNFGELLAHPILESLRGGENQWLVDFLYTFNSGNLENYEKLRASWSLQPDLKASELSLRQKISLLCLMEMTFKRPANSRQLTFKEIASEARLPEEEVELLVMKALSLSLVRGSIDQVDKKVHMTWVQPRVLDKNQISTMQQRLELWCKDVNSMEELLESKAKDILT